MVSLEGYEEHYNMAAFGNFHSGPEENVTHISMTYGNPSLKLRIELLFDEWDSHDGLTFPSRHGHGLILC